MELLRRRHLYVRSTKAGLRGICIFLRKGSCVYDILVRPMFTCSLFIVSAFRVLCVKLSPQISARYL